MFVVAVAPVRDAWMGELVSRDGIEGRDRRADVTHRLR